MFQLRNAVNTMIYLWSRCNCQRVTRFWVQTFCISLILLESPKVRSAMWTLIPSLWENTETALFVPGMIQSDSWHAFLNTHCITSCHVHFLLYMPSQNDLKICHHSQCLVTPDTFAFFREGIAQWGAKRQGVDPFPRLVENPLLPLTLCRKSLGLARATTKEQKNVVGVRGALHVAGRNTAALSDGLWAPIVANAWPIVAT